ncbi:YdeI/OmpD-associated family protein [Nocardioides sp.]|uniref:YdeI/OmpD-associated family protein n=1 Tax=Nocardioides sp. TaxID=35761 RepID=UPI003510E84D
MTEVGPHEFSAALEPLEWGRATYTILRVPPELVAAAGAEGTRRVAGTIEDVEVNLALTKADVTEGVFLWAGASLQRRLGARPGDVVECRLAPVDPDVVLVPDDVRAALDDAGRSEAFEALRPSQRRQLLVPVDDAARPDTRARRIAALVAGLPPGM